MFPSFMLVFEGVTVFSTEAWLWLWSLWRVKSSPRDFPRHVPSSNLMDATSCNIGGCLGFFTQRMDASTHLKWMLVKWIIFHKEKGWKSTNVSTIMESKSKFGAAKKGDHPELLLPKHWFWRNRGIRAKKCHWVTFYVKRAHSPLGV